MYHPTQKVQTRGYYKKVRLIIEIHETVANLDKDKTTFDELEEIIIHFKDNSSMMQYNVFKIELHASRVLKKYYSLKGLNTKKAKTTSIVK